MRISLMLLLSYLITMTVAANATVNPFHYADSKKLSYSTVIEKGAECPFKLMEPYKGDLLFESKYDQSDKSKSTLKEEVDPDTKKNKEYLDTFTKNIAKYSSYAVSGKSIKKKVAAIQCVNSNLLNWASNNSLLDVKTTKTGIAVKKWFLASISAALLKLDAGYDGYVIDPSVKKWLLALSNEVKEYYKPRMNDSSIHFNNHDYWAAWAVAASSVLTGNESGLTWPLQVLKHAVVQAKFDKTTKVAYLPYEIERGQLAANYSNFALIPLMFLADLYYSNSVDIKDELTVLQQLAKFSVQLNNNPKSLVHIVSMPQDEVRLDKFVWLLPYGKLYGTDKLIKQMNIKSPKDLYYSGLGGDLTLFYPDIIQ